MLAFSGSGGSRCRVGVGPVNIPTHQPQAARSRASAAGISRDGASPDGLKSSPIDRSPRRSPTPGAGSHHQHDTVGVLSQPLDEGAGADTERRPGFTISAPAGIDDAASARRTTARPSRYRSIDRARQRQFGLLTRRPRVHSIADQRGPDSNRRHPRERFRHREGQESGQQTSPENQRFRTDLMAVVNVWRLFTVRGRFLLLSVRGHQRVRVARTTHPRPRLSTREQRRAGPTAQTGLSAPTTAGTRFRIQAEPAASRLLGTERGPLLG